jgi:hypothetical protein
MSRAFPQLGRGIAQCLLLRGGKNWWDCSICFNCLQPGFAQRLGRTIAVIAILFTSAIGLHNPYLNDTEQLDNKW